MIFILANQFPFNFARKFVLDTNDTNARSKMSKTLPIKVLIPIIPMSCKRGNVGIACVRINLYLLTSFKLVEIHVINGNFNWFLNISLPDLLYRLSVLSRRSKTQSIVSTENKPFIVDFLNKKNVF